MREERARRLREEHAAQRRELALVAEERERLSPDLLDGNPVRVDFGG